MKRRNPGLITVLFCWLLALPLLSVYPLLPPESFADFVNDFTREYESLDFPGYSIAYADNFARLPGPDQLERGASFSASFRKRLAEYPTSSLTPEQRIDYQLIEYELNLLDQYLQLATSWRAADASIEPDVGLSKNYLGTAWYRYYLKRWIDQSVEPEQLMAFGHEQVARAHAGQARIQEASGLDSIAFREYLDAPVFFYQDQKSVHRACVKLHERLAKTLDEYFPRLAEIPPLTIAAGTDPRLARVPGFYRDNTFFYNYFDRPFNKRQIGWLYVHEGLPGHHYERNYARQFSRPTQVSSLFNYSAYTEGWGAYVEEIGGEYGAYPTPYDQYGKWEWDLIRSLRVVMDVGLNYYDWSDEKALAYWREHLSGLDDIGQREIDRMRRWPAQVITYKYGADRLLQFLREAKAQPDFNWKNFHERVLAYGPLPLTILAEQL
ncbi:DUF885 domain-containing protein [Lewinella sp. W8]|uniref:DUF885 domain-containing protein n=1 Tax=Lewinella sp. W8 TaxID=2528208 RepID=UPI001067B219|nr:DUF885 domain-containing protein [Lewinella sp. W8]MTB51477.1 DUF885 family protein [Lewinella sp. W8]